MAFYSILLGGGTCMILFSSKFSHDLQKVDALMAKKENHKKNLWFFWWGMMRLKHLTVMCSLCTLLMFHSSLIQNHFPFESTHCSYYLGRILLFGKWVLRTVTKCTKNHSNDLKKVKEMKNMTQEFSQEWFLLIHSCSAQNLAFVHHCITTALCICTGRSYINLYAENGLNVYFETLLSLRLMI